MISIVNINSMPLFVRQTHSAWAKPIVLRSLDLKKLLHRHRGSCTAYNAVPVCATSPLNFFCCCCCSSSPPALSHLTSSCSAPQWPCSWISIFPGLEQMPQDLPLYISTIITLQRLHLTFDLWTGSDFWLHFSWALSLLLCYVTPTTSDTIKD